MIKKNKASHLLLLVFSRLINLSVSFKSYAQQKTDCESIDSLVRIIDDNPDPLNILRTASVYRLSRCGMPAIAAVLPLLSDSSEATRRRAYAVISTVLVKLNASAPDYENTPQVGKKTEAIKKENGSFDPEKEPLANKGSIEKWEKWVEKNK